jgi:hypothetical protein
MPWLGKTIQTDLPEQARRDSISSITKKEDKTRKTTSSGLSLPSWATSNTDDSAKSREAATARSTSVLMGRGIFVFFLIIVAITLGLLAWYFLYKAELNLMEAQYRSMMARALEVTRSLAVSMICVFLSFGV